MPKRKRENRPCLTSTTSPRPNITSTIMSDGDKIWLTSPACPLIENISYRSRAFYNQSGGRSLRNLLTLTPYIFLHKPWKSSAWIAKKSILVAPLNTTRKKLIKMDNWLPWYMPQILQLFLLRNHLCFTDANICTSPELFQLAAHRYVLVSYPSVPFCATPKLLGKGFLKKISSVLVEAWPSNPKALV